MLGSPWFAKDCVHPVLSEAVREYSLVTDELPLMPMCQYPVKRPPTWTEVICHDFALVADVS